MDLFFTHAPVISYFASICEKPILEVGCGYYSTFILHSIAAAKGIDLYSVEEDESWRRKFLMLESHRHRILDSTDKVSGNFGIVFVDNAPSDKRVPVIKEMKDRSDIIIIHDSEDVSYNYESIYGLFKFRFDYTVLKPWTTVLSNKDNVIMKG